MAKKNSRGWTLLVLSEGDSNHRQFRVSRGLVIALGCVLGLIVTYTITQTFLLVSVSNRAAVVEPLRQRVRDLEAEQTRMAHLGSQVTDLRRFEQQLRRALASREGDTLSSPPWEPMDAALSEYDTLIPEPVMTEFEDLLISAPAIGNREVVSSDLPTCSPVRGYITREFSGSGPYRPIVHEGIDIAAREGTPIRAAADGIVTFSGWSYPYGKLLVVAHRSGYTTFYGHNQTLLAHTGDQVLQGQPIALLGNSGRSTAPHLHFEIWEEGRSIDPLTLLGPTGRTSG